MNKLHILRDKDKLAEILQDWANTFEAEEGGDEEDVTPTLDKIIKKVENGELCTDDDVEEIQFHLWQISCSEEEYDQWELIIN